MENAMLVDQITEDMKQAMKSGDKDRLAAIRMLRAALKDKEIEIGHTLEEADVVAVLSRLVKQRKDSAAQYADAGRADLEAKELAEVDIFQAYLPEQLAEDEIVGLIEKAVAETGASSMRDMGQVMGKIRPQLQGRADMGHVSALVKARLQG
jgi:hypothetical protein